MLLCWFLFFQIINAYYRIPLTVIPRDIGYTAKIYMGSHHQPFVVIIDTGSADLWVPSVDCTIEACLKHLRYNPSRSADASSTGVTFKIHYGSGTVSGYVFKDSLEVGGMKIENQEFGLITNHISTFANEPFDGILGLGFSTISVVHAKTPLDHLYSRGFIQNKIFSLFLESETSNHSSYMLLGGYSSRAILGEITWIPLIASTGYWTIPLEGGIIELGNQTIHLDFKANAIFDSGTTVILAPKKYAKLLHSHIKGAKKFKFFSDLYIYPCSELIFNLGFIFGNRTWMISRDDVISGTLHSGETCLSAIQATHGDDWIFGGNFLRSVYSIWDAQNRKIGLANKNY